MYSSVTFTMQPRDWTTRRLRSKRKRQREKEIKDAEKPQEEKVKTGKTQMRNREEEERDKPGNSGTIVADAVVASQPTTASQNQ